MIVVWGRTSVLDGEGNEAANIDINSSAVQVYYICLAAGQRSHAAVLWRCWSWFLVSFFILTDTVNRIVPKWGYGWWERCYREDDISVQHNDTLVKWLRSHNRVREEQRGSSLFPDSSDLNRITVQVSFSANHQNFSHQLSLPACKNLIVLYAKQTFCEAYFMLSVSQTTLPMYRSLSRRSDEQTGRSQWWKHDSISVGVLAELK